MGRRKTPLPFPETGRLIRKYRLLRGYSVIQLSEMVSIEAAYLSNLESGAQMPGIRVLHGLSVSLNVPIERLLLPESDIATDTDYKTQLIRDIERLSPEEAKLVHDLLYHCLPHMRKAYDN